MRLIWSKDDINDTERTSELLPGRAEHYDSYVADDQPDIIASLSVTVLVFLSFIAGTVCGALASIWYLFAKHASGAS